MEPSRLEQAQTHYYQNIAEYYKVLTAWIRLTFALVWIYIVLSVLFPIFACITLWGLWTFGDALLGTR